MAALKPGDQRGDKPDDPQLRDELLARLLTDALHAPAANVTATATAPITPATQDAVCPDAETIAAYADHSLATEEMAQLDIHFADCARCQQILAALAVSSDESPVPKVALAPTPIRIPRPAPIPAQPTRWRWLAPAAGIAAAVALWFVLRPAPSSQNIGSQIDAKNEAPVTQAPAAPPTNQDTAQNNSEIAEANIPSPPTPSASPLPSPTVAAAAALPQESRPLDALKTPEATDETRAAVAGPQPAGPPPVSAPSPQFLRAQRGFAPATTSKTETVTVTGDLPAVNTAKTQLGEVLEQPMIEDLPLEARNYPYLLSTPPGQIGTTQELRAASSAPVSRGETAARSSGVTGGYGAVSALAPRPLSLAQAAAPASTFASPSGDALWRIGVAGSIERSSDRGRTWQRQSSGVTGDLLAGAAASDQAAWIVGRGGIILRTTDGANWQRVSLPAALTANGALDLSAVQASDALHATITATGGRRFTTRDGGKTWTAQ
jgi:hypothetical protein